MTTEMQMVDTRDHDAERANEDVNKLLEKSEESQVGYFSELVAYMAPLRKYPPLTDPEKYNPLFAIYRGQDKVASVRARDLLVYGNIKLVVKTALRYQWRGLALSDLIQEGVLGLMHALEMFEVDHGERFSTYGTHWIRQAITRAIRNTSESEIFRTPVHKGDKLAIIFAATRDSYLKKGRHPTTLEVYQQIKTSGLKSAENISLIDVKEGMQANVENKRVTRLDAAMPDDGDDYGSVIGEVQKTETIVEARRLYREYRTAVDRIEAVINGMPSRTAMIMRLRLGLGEFDAQSLEGIGERYEITRERVRQIEATAFERIKNAVGVDSTEIVDIINTMEELEAIAHAV